MNPLMPGIVLLAGLAAGWVVVLLVRRRRPGAGPAAWDQFDLLRLLGHDCAWAVDGEDAATGTCRRCAGTIRLAVDRAGTHPRITAFPPAGEDEPSRLLRYCPGAAR